MYKLILVNERKFEKTEFTLDNLENNYVRVKNIYCGICGGDISAYNGKRKRYPVSLGHEGIGEVIYSKHSAFKIGDIVITDFNYRCGVCKFCKNESHLCDKNDIQLFSNRMFSSHSDIHFSYLEKIIPNAKNFHHLTLAEPLSCCLHAIQSYNINIFENILINGCGGIGMLMGFALKFVFGKKNIFFRDINSVRQEKCVNYFNAYSFDSSISFDLIIDATNSVDGLLFSCNQALKGSIVCIMSHLYGDDTSRIFDLVQQKELHIFSPLRNGQKSNLKKAGKLLIDFWDTSFNDMLRIYSNTEITEAFEDTLRSRYNKHIIKL